MNDIEILENMAQQYKSANFPKAQLPKKIEERIYKHEIIAIENLIQRNKDLEQIEKEHKEENGRLRDKIKELEEIDIQSIEEIEPAMNGNACVIDNKTWTLNQVIKAVKQLDKKIKEK